MNYRTQNLNLAVESSRQGNFVQVQIAIMMTPDLAAQLCEGVSAMQAQVPGAADPERSKFLADAMGSIATIASDIKSGK